MTEILRLRVVRYSDWRKRGTGETEEGMRLKFTYAQLAQKGITMVRRGDLLTVEATKVQSGRYLVSRIVAFTARAASESAESARVDLERTKTETKAASFFERWW